MTIVDEIRQAITACHASGHVARVVHVPHLRYFDLQKADLDYALNPTFPKLPSDSLMGMSIAFGGDKIEVTP